MNLGKVGPSCSHCGHAPEQHLQSLSLPAPCRADGCACSDMTSADPVSAGISDWRREIIAIHERVAKRWPVGSEDDKNYLCLGLAGEVGELANLFKKRWRGDPMGPGSKLDDFKDRVRGELADIRVYLELVAFVEGVNLDEAVNEKLPEIRRRFPIPG